MPVLELNNISKSYDQKSLVVQNISFSLERDDFLVLLGPSGCGKSTILNMIAGLESVTSGDIFLNGVRINDLSSQNRNIAMVFQNYALYPNMTVWDNIAFPLKNRHMKKSEIINAISQIAETLSIKPLLKKYPSQLSGGEKQRVAIGRALVRKPSLFLLDEPLSNLDTALRNQLRYELFQLEIMKANGFYEIKMEYTTLNHTVWEDLKNRIIDLHCFEYTDEGEILYDGDCFPVETFSGKGRIEEIEVSCIEPYSQVMFHLGYEFDENDAHDVKLLCETLHIEIPNEYR